jgi:hypothetical protein
MIIYEGDARERIKQPPRPFFFRPESRTTWKRQQTTTTTTRSSQKSSWKNVTAAAGAARVTKMPVVFYSILFSSFQWLLL